MDLRSMRSFVYFICVFLQIPTTEEFSFAELETFLTNTKYQLKDHPRVDVPGTATDVAVQIDLLQFGPIDDVLMTFVVGITLRMWLNDPRLAIENTNKSTTEYSSLTFKDGIQEHIWLPDLWIPNGLKFREVAGIGSTRRAVISGNGDVYFATALKIIVDFEMDLHQYPFDTQHGELSFESWAYGGDLLRLSWHNTSIKYYAPKKDTVQLSGYELIGWTSEVDEVPYILGGSTHVWQTMRAKFAFKRTTTFYVLRIYIQSSFLVAMTWASFWIPSSSYPARVALIVTNCLSSMVIYASSTEKITQIDYITPLTLYMLVNITFILMALLQFIIVANSHSRRRRSKVDTILEGTSAVADEQDQRKEEKLVLDDEMHFMDRWSRICFPLSYAIFLVVYYQYYLS